MIFVPLPFVVALLLALLALRLLRSEERGRHHLLFLALICTYAVQSVLVGLRWGYDIRAVLPVQAVLASFVAPLTYVAFRSLAEVEAPRHRLHPLLHLLVPPLTVALLIARQPSPVGPVIVALFLFYGAALFWLARRGPDGLIGSRLDGAIRSYRALVISAGALVASALMDIVISLDLETSGGQYTPVLIALFNVVALLVLGAAAAAADSGTPPDAGEPASPPTPPAETGDAGEDAAILAALDELMRGRRLFTDVDLDLGRLARRLGLPARRLSQAINRAHGVSVSHYVNALRVEEARRLLAATDLPVTRVMLDAGFLTKSNFNREFRRLAGMSPSQWRAAHRKAPAAPQPL